MFLSFAHLIHCAFDSKHHMHLNKQSVVLTVNFSVLKLKIKKNLRLEIGAKNFNDLSWMYLITSAILWETYIMHVIIQGLNVSYNLLQFLTVILHSESRSRYKNIKNAYHMKHYNIVCSVIQIDIIKLSILGQTKIYNHSWFGLYYLFQHYLKDFCMYYSKRYQPMLSKE